MSANLHWLDDARLAGTMLEAALIYAANDWRVFPLIGKHPPVDGGFHLATTDTSQIREWWARWPHANIGWSLPPRWFAIDEDPRHDGHKSRDLLRQQHEPLPFTLRQVSGGGGYHWIYRAPDGVEIRQCAGFMPGLDTRVSGKGYLVVAPSLHPLTHKPYTWSIEVAPVVAPAWLVDLVKFVPPAPAPIFVPPPRPAAALDRGRRWARAALDGLSRDVATAGSGTRNDTLYHAFARMMRMVAGGLIDEREVRATLRGAGLACGLPEREVDRVLR